jgi:AcrR family transcriptional regulator
MSPRPRQVSDAQILEATLRAIQRLGPVRMTLADVARELGVSAPAIVRRFGTRRALLLKLASGAPEGQAGCFALLRAAHPSPVAALLGLADAMAVMGRTPTEIAHSLAFLEIDLTDPDFHRYALASSRAIHHGITDLVRHAVRAGELTVPDARRLASAIQATMNGSMLNWAIHRDGTLAAWIRRDLAMVLAPYRTGGPSGKPRSRRRTLKR